MGGRPRSASALSGQRLGAGGSLSASTGGLFWKKHRLGSGSSNGKVHDVDDDSGPDGVVSSSLTMGNGALVGGGPAAALRRRRADPVVSSLRQLSSSVDPSLRKSIGSPDMSTEQILVRPGDGNTRLRLR